MKEQCNLPINMTIGTEHVTNPFSGTDSRCFADLNCNILVALVNHWFIQRHLGSEGVRIFIMT